MSSSTSPSRVSDRAVSHQYPDNSLSKEQSRITFSFFSSQKMIEIDFRGSRIFLRKLKQEARNEYPNLLFHCPFLGPPGGFSSSIFHLIRGMVSGDSLSLFLQRLLVVTTSSYQIISFDDSIDNEWNGPGCKYMPCHGRTGCMWPRNDS